MARTMTSAERRRRMEHNRKKPYLEGEYAYVPIINEAMRPVKVEVVAYRRLKRMGYTGTGWVRDETGAVRCRRVDSCGRSDETEYFDVAAIMHHLKKGTRYVLPNPYDLTTIKGTA
ncbi:hypothetical protein [Paraburkholderia tropica]|uniref:hypothetical protein n=1 Tax=Paraburkholderia tropica TaxID=92647 RepID=UPI002AB08BE4|nr:hypothetical protein [Paraburkholderia tropica]